MRKLKTIALVSVLSFASSAAFATGTFEIKGGAASVKAAGDRVGFDAAIGFGVKIERFFVAMPELGFNWINYDRCATDPCIVVAQGATTGILSETRNHYTLPLIMNLRFNVPMGSDDVPMVQPFVTVGAGYAWTFYKATTPSYTTGLGAPVAATTTNADAGGLAYQALAGLQFNLGMMADGSASSTNLIIEGGYRGMEVERSNVKTNLSGFLVRVGAAFSF